MSDDRNPERGPADPRRALARLQGDEEGSVTIWVAVSAAALLGLVGLALDLSREEITHTEAQAAADAAALAGAAQLDQTSGSCARAASAAQTLVANRQKFAGSGGTVTFSAANCLSGLPANDFTPIGSSYITTSDTSARFLQVVTRQLTHNNMFLQLVGAPATATVQSSAVAGFSQGVCKVPALMMCNPDESGGGGQTFDPSTVAGKEIWAKGGAYGPGDYGLIQSPLCGTPSGSCIRSMLAANAPNECFGSTVSPAPGQKTGPTNQGFNVRFSGNSATQSPDYVTINYPEDSNISSGVTIGNGVWDCQTYWKSNHTGAAPAGCGPAGSNTMTRYQMYQYEESKIPTTLPSTEPKPSANALTNRRILYMAVVNCKQYNIQGSSGPVPYVGWLKALMLKPASGDVYVEGIALATPATDPTVVRDDIQLYR